MVKGIYLGKEITVSIVNKIGVLADMSKVLSDHGINIEAVSGQSSEDNTAKIVFVTDDNLRAVDALKKAGYKSIKETETIIIELENKPGALKNITSALVQKEIDIQHIYGTACVSGCPSRVVLSTSDNQKALLMLKK